MIKSIKFASIPARDQDASLAFYTEKIGMAVVTDQPFDGRQRWIELRIPGAETRLVLFTMKGQEDRAGQFSNIVFMADDVEKTYAELKEKGVEFLGEPRKESWGTSVVFKDPDGTQFLISSK